MSQFTKVWLEKTIHFLPSIDLVFEPCFSAKVCKVWEKKLKIELIFCHFDLYYNAKVCKNQHIWQNLAKSSYQFWTSVRYNLAKSSKIIKISTYLSIINASQFWPSVLQSLAKASSQFWPDVWQSFKKHQIFDMFTRVNASQIWPSVWQSLAKSSYQFWSSVR